MAWRADPNDVISEINAGIAELRAWRPDAIEGEIEALPLPGSNNELVLRLQKDSIDLTENEYIYSRAAGIIERAAKTGRGVERHRAGSFPTLFQRF